MFDAESSSERRVACRHRARAKSRDFIVGLPLDALRFLTPAHVIQTFQQNGGRPWLNSTSLHHHAINAGCMLRSS